MTISMTGEASKQSAGLGRASDAARVLRSESVSLLDEWSLRVRSDPSIPSTSKVGERGLRDRFLSMIEDLAHALDLIARGADPGSAPVRSIAARTAFAHALGRVAAGYSIGEMMREISQLHATASELLERRGACDARIARALTTWAEGAMRIAAEEASRIASAEAKEAERSLRRRDALLRAVIDHTPSVVYVKDLEGRNLLANRQFERVLGIGRADIQGKLDEELFSPDEVAAFRATDARALERREEIEVEETVSHADGPHTYVSVKFPVRDADGEVWAIGGISTDVTERRRDEVALAQSEWRFRTIFDVAPIGIVDIDVTTRKIARANAEACRMTGHAPGELDGADMDELTHEDDRAKTEAALRPVLAELEPLYDDEKRFRRKGGGWLHARVRATLVRDGAGRPVRALALIEDVGARRELELLRERLVAVVAHDLRGPLSTVRMALQLLRARDHDAPCDAQLIDKIDRGSRGMQEMISTLLDFARAQGGTFPIDRQDADLAAIAQGVVEDSRLAAPDRQIVLEVEGDPRGRWDPSRLAQVVANLLSNALHHGDPRAPVRVSVRARSSNDVQLEVWNQGRPIPAEMQSSIFEPYRRGEDDAKGGLGLGLYITCAIVRAHDGAIRVARSDAEHGTVFSVELPRG